MGGDVDEYPKESPAPIANVFEKEITQEARGEKIPGPTLKGGGTP